MGSTDTSVSPGSTDNHNRATATSCPSVISSASWCPVYQATSSSVAQTTSKAPTTQLHR